MIAPSVWILFVAMTCLCLVGWLEVFIAKNNRKFRTRIAVCSVLFTTLFVASVPLTANKLATHPQDVMYLGTAANESDTEIYATIILIGSVLFLAVSILRLVRSRD